MVTRRGDGRPTEEIPSVTTSDVEVMKKWHRGARAQARYWKTAITGPFNDVNDFQQTGGEDIDYAIQKVLEWLEKHHGSHMRLYGIEIKFRDFYIKNDILTWAVVTVIAEPIRGEVPLRGPKRS